MCLVEMFKVTFLGLNLPNVINYVIYYPEIIMGMCYANKCKCFLTLRINTAMCGSALSPSIDSLMLHPQIQSPCAFCYF